MISKLPTNLEDVKSSIVMIYAIDFDGKEFFQGSGVILRELGVVVTNLHILINYKSIKIVKGRLEIPFGEIVGMDEENDILILSLDTSSFSSIKIGSGKFLKNGQKIYTVSNPKGVENSIVEGRILGIRREISGNHISLGYTSNKFLQFSADITHGSSGGAILNEQLELIGIIFAQTLRDKTFNYAVPIDNVLEIINTSETNNPTLMKSSILNFQGNNAYNNKDMPSAIKYFSKSLEVLPDKYDVLVKRAEAYNELKKYDLAFSDCDKAINMFPEEAEAYGVKGQTYQLKKNFENCEEYYLKALQIDAYIYEVLFNLSFCYYQKCDFEKTIEYIDRTLDIEPLFLEAIILKGDCFFELNESDKAIEMYNKSLEFRDGDSSFYVGIGNALLKQTKFNESITFFDKAIELDSRNSLAYKMKVDSCIVLKNKELAGITLNKMFKIFPNRIENYHDRATFYYGFGDFENALLDLIKYSIYVSPNAELYFAIGTCCHRMDQIQKSINYYDIALSLNDEFVKIYIYRGYAYRKINKHLEAINDFSEYILHLENDYDAYIIRGRSYYDINKIDKAIKDFTRAIEIDDVKAGAYCERGICYCNICGLDRIPKALLYLNKVPDDLSKAIEDLNKAISLDPNYAEAYYFRSMCYFAIGSIPSATKDLENAVLLNPDYKEELRSHIVETLKSQGKKI